MKSEFEEIMDRIGNSTLAGFGQDGVTILTAAYKARTVEDAIKTHLIENEHARRANEEAKTKQMYIAMVDNYRACNIDNITSGAKIMLNLMDVHPGTKPQCDRHIIIDNTPKDVLLAMQTAMPDYLVLLETRNSYIPVYFVDSPETEQPR